MKHPRLAALLLALALLSSCAGPANSDGSGDTTTAAETTAADTTTAAETEPPFIAVNLNGQEFIILSREAEASMLCEAGTEATGEVLSDAIAKRNAAVEEDLSVKLTPMPVQRNSMNKTALTMLQSGVKAFDIGLINYTTVPSLVGLSGALLPLDEIDTLDLEADWWDPASLEAFRLGQNRYFAVGDLNLNATLAIYGLLFNQKLVTDLQLESPYELVKSQKWTMDEMYNMMQVAQKDLNGDSVMDNTDRYGMICTANGFKYMFTHTGEQLVRNEKGGSLTVNKTQRLYDVVDKVLPVTNMGYLAGSGKSTDLNAFFQTNQALFYQTGIQSTLELRDMQSDYGILPGPKADESQENYCSPLAASWTSVTMVPSWTKNADDVGTVLNALGYYSKEYVTPAVAEFLLPAKLARDKNSVQMLEIMNSTKLYAVNAAFNFGKTEDILTRIQKAQTNTMASELAALESAAAKAIEDLLASQK